MFGRLVLTDNNNTIVDTGPWHDRPTIGTDDEHARLERRAAKEKLTVVWEELHPDGTVTSTFLYRWVDAP